MSGPVDRTGGKTKNRLAWDNLPQADKMSYLYEWNEDLGQHVDQLLARVAELETRLHQVERRNSEEEENSDHPT
jgi:hypothetical protein